MPEPEELAEMAANRRDFRNGLILSAVAVVTVLVASLAGVAFR